MRRKTAKGFQRSRRSLLGGNLHVALDLDTLGKELLQATGAADLLHGGLGLVNEAGTEGAKSDLDKSPVVKNLRADVGNVDGLLEMRHQEHVARLVELVVQGVVVDVAKHGAGAEDGGVVLVKVGAQDVEKVAGHGGLVAGRDDRVDIGGDRLPGVGLAGGDDLLGLQTVSKPNMAELRAQTLK